MKLEMRFHRSWANDPLVSMIALLLGLCNWAITPALAKEIAIPTLDISKETQRHVVVEWGTPDVYQGHVDTLLMPDGKTMWAVWTQGHAGPCGPMKLSKDGGLTWQPFDRGPANLKSIDNCPTIHRLADPSGAARLFLFAGNGVRYQSHSDNDGKTWTPMAPNGLKGTVSPISILPVENGRLLRMWYDAGPGPTGADGLPQSIWQAESADGGLTWRNAKKIISDDDASPNEPDVIRSPDSRQLLMLMRIEKGRLNSRYSTSDDEGATWSNPQELTASLTGHRHHALYAPDGRLVVVMRDMADRSPTKGSFVAWVGKYDDIVHGRLGQYRVKLLHQFPNPNTVDCGYAGLELLADGTFVATTYVKYTAGPEKNSIVSVRFNLSDLDTKAAAMPRRR
jgi:hypothetical protein